MMQASFSIALTTDRRSLAAVTLSETHTVPCRPCPLFSLRLRTRAGEAVCGSAFDAEKVTGTETGDTLVLRYEKVLPEVDVLVTVRQTESECRWRIAVENRSAMAVEYTEFPSLILGDPIRSGSGSAILYPYNEGALIEDGTRKPGMPEAEYPSCGWFSMFPNMVFSQFLAYLHPDGGLYIGLHDPKRGEKLLDFGCSGQGTEFRLRTYAGGRFGGDYRQDFDTVFAPVQGGWMDAAEIYRAWFEENKPAGLRKAAENPALPDWYGESPVVITYPVRGQHDMDVMEPNGLFPYEKALPRLESFRKVLQTNFLVLLMHWEGTAPWAPPYVWPPYGGTEMLDQFREALHARGDRLGVYCSGIGWTMQSHLVEDYRTDRRFAEEHLDRMMCRAPDGSLPLSRICTGQRAGYDICPEAEGARQLLQEALAPLLDSGVDYVQALDQNHGGGMYLCYGQEHGHPPMPGAWMTEAMEKTLAGWQRDGGPLLGCESSAAEPFLPYLALSDNRYELNYAIGRPVPLFACLFHEYLHNFMGNQVSCPLAQDTLSLCHRLAYSFAAGDFLTLVINDRGRIMPRWGMRDFSVLPEEDTVLAFAAALTAHRKLLPEFCRGARMTKPFACTSPECALPVEGRPAPLAMESVLSTAWETEAGTLQLFVNYTDTDAVCTVQLGRRRRGTLLYTGESPRPFEESTLSVAVAAHSVCSITVLAQRPETDDKKRQA